MQPTMARESSARALACRIDEVIEIIPLDHYGRDRIVAKLCEIGDSLYRVDPSDVSQKWCAAEGVFGKRFLERAAVPWAVEVRKLLSGK